MPPPETPEAAARNRYSRQIDKAFEEASRLAGSNLAPTDFYEKFLNAALPAIDAPAGVVWLRTPQGFLQIACQVNLDKVGLDDKRGGRQCHNEILRQVFQSAPPRPVLVEPQGRLTGVTAEPGGVPAANLTDYYTLFAPIVTADRQPIGLFEVFQEASLDPRLYQTFLQYAVQMAGYASQYHHFAGTRQSSGLEKVFTQLESFAKLIHGSLNPTEVAYHVANEGRRVVECDRLCVGVRYSKGCTVEAVSGADVVEKASTHVRRMKALFDAVLKFGDKLVYKGTKDEGLPPDLSHALDDYLAESQPKLLVVTPIRDEREKDATRPARSILLLESFNPPENTEPLIQRLEVVGKHAAPALYNAWEVKRIPFGIVWRPLAKLQESLGGRNGFIAAGVALLVAVIATALVLIPWPLKMDAKGEFLPETTVQVFAPHEGEVRAVLVSPDQRVAQGEPVVALYSPQLQEKQQQSSLELSAANAEAQEYEQFLRRPGLSSDQESDLQSKVARAKGRAKGQDETLRQMKAMYNTTSSRPGEFTASAPQFDPKMFERVPQHKDDNGWRVLSGDVRESLKQRTVRPNEPLVRLGYVSGPWWVELKIPQRNIGHITKALATEGRYKVDAAGKKYLDVDVLFTASPDTSYKGRLYADKMAQEAIPNRDDHNESEPIVPAYVRVNVAGAPADSFPADGEERVPRELLVAGQEVHVKIRCGDRPLGYSLFHGVWEWFYEKVVFFF